MIKTPEAKVDCLNRLFSSVFNTDSSIPEQELVEQDLTLGNIILSKKLILDKLTSIKTDKSPGPDTILPRVLYECRFELVNPLYVLFRACCEQSKIPSEWKKANVIPIYKKGKKSDPSNYRPISLTSTVDPKKKAYSWWIRLDASPTNILQHILNNRCSDYMRFFRFRVNLKRQN